jgi:hypothetical protein
MIRDRRSQLNEALHNKLLVRFWNPYDSGSTQGYILDIGPRFFLLGLIGEGVKFNGFQCLRLSDVRRLQAPDQYAEFVVSALQMRNQRIDKKPRIDLGGLPELLKSANRLFPLVTIHRERVTPDTCNIGRVIDVKRASCLYLKLVRTQFGKRNQPRLRCVKSHESTSVVGTKKPCI